MPASRKTDDAIEKDLADERERSGKLGKQLDKLAEEVAPKEPAGDDTWKGDVA
ncbi:MAG TPA: hypothetical protein VN806_14275 [Caulobacteraceae bacterium]|nr:hypothetical protein [Caulobacteraceae bacterium]